MMPDEDPQIAVGRGASFDEKMRAVFGQHVADDVRLRSEREDRARSVLDALARLVDGRLGQPYEAAMAAIDRFGPA
jgi:hypothetical protein